MIAYAAWLILATAGTVTVAGILWLVFVGLIIAHASETLGDFDDE